MRPLASFLLALAVASAAVGQTATTPARDAYQKPDEVLKALALREGEVAEHVFLPYQYFRVFTVR